MSKYGFSAHRANIANSLVYLISAGASPIFGFAVDKTGFNLYWRKYLDIIILYLFNCILNQPGHINQPGHMLTWEDYMSWHVC